MTGTASVRVTEPPRIAITMGDAAGVGPELCLHVLAHPALAAEVTPLVFGDAALLERVAAACGQPVPRYVVDRVDALDTVHGPAVVQIDGLDAAGVQPGVIQADAGAAAHRYIQAAIQAARAGTVHAVTTAPIHKEALHAAGIPHPGHTEIFAAATGAARTCMMLTSETITCSLATIHIGYRDVPIALSVEGIVDTIELTAAAMQRLRGRAPRLAVLGLNPHAGEGGLFGDREEERIIAPAVARARAAGIDVVGPLPPDTAFIPSWLERIDAYVCMYHDQGLIPLKALAFDQAVNVTLGLPIVRTSVDHGTAFDIAWQGRANPASLIAAIRLAARLAS